MNITSNKNKSFKQKVISAGFFTISTHILSQLLRLASNLILTRLLAPEVFGQMAIIQTIIFGLVLVSDIGLHQNLIQSNKSHIPEFVNTIWTLQVIRGFGITLLGLSFSLLLYYLITIDFFKPNSVYGDPNLPLLVAAISITSAISGFSSTKMIMADRELNTLKLSIVNLATQIFGIIIIVILAYFFKNIWSLVLGSLVGTLMSVTLSFLCFEGIKNRFYLEKTYVKDVTNFGKWIFFTSVLGFFSSSADSLILSSMVDSKALGLYSIAAMLLTPTHAIILKLSASVALPAMSHLIRLSDNNLKNKYYQIRFWIDFGSLMIAGFLFATAELFVSFLYDERYYEVGEVLKILSISVAMYRYTISEQFYIAKGQPKTLLYISIPKVICMLIGVPIAISFYGFFGAVWYIVINGLLTLPIHLYLQQKNGILDIRKELVVLPLALLGYVLGVAFTAIF